VFLASPENQFVHGGIKTLLVAWLIIGPHIEWTVGFEAKAFESAGQIAIFQVNTAYRLFHDQSLPHNRIVGIQAKI